MDAHKYKHMDRYDYPFISDNGEQCRLLTDAVDDIVVWISDVKCLPISVVASADNGTLSLTFMSNTGSVLAYADTESQVILTVDGILCGYVLWNTDGSAILKSAIIANDPQPWSTVHISPSACMPRSEPKMSAIAVNNVDNDDLIVRIATEDPNIGVSSGDLVGKALNIYSDDYGNADPIDKIVFHAVDNKNTVTIDGINNHVWLKSDAECDIRVVTSDGITLTEISNDKL